MKKAKLKNYLKLGILLFGVSLLLINCDKDTIEEVQIENIPKLTVTIVDLSDIESNEKVFSKIERIVKPKDKYTSNSRDTISNNEYGFIIDTDYVKYVENGNYNSYNFEIIRDNPEDDKLENLFLTLNEDGEYDTFIIKYDFTIEELNSLTQNELDSRTTQYTAINFDSSFLNRGSTFRDADLECESQWVFDGCLESPRGPDYILCFWVEQIVCTGGGGPGPGPSSGNPTSDPISGGNQGSGSSGGSTGTTPSNPYSAPTALSSYGQEILDCLQSGAILAYRNSSARVVSYTTWLSTASINQLGALATYIHHNGCSDETRELVFQAIDILNANPDANPFIGADCRSFEYAQPPGALQKACAVTNFGNNFYYGFIRVDGSWEVGYFDSNFPLIYFTMPPYGTNGQAANFTAEAVTAATRITDAYVLANADDLSEEDVKNEFQINLQNAMGLIGGSITLTPPFTIPSPAPYLTNLLGAQTDCN